MTDGPRAGAVKPLVFALPHHVASLTSPSPVSPTIRLSSRVNGYMTLYSGSSWSLKEDVSIVGQFGVQMANPTLSSQVKPTANDLAVLQQFAQAEVGIDFSAESNLPTYCTSCLRLFISALTWCLSKISLARSSQSRPCNALPSRHTSAAPAPWHLNVFRKRKRASCSSRLGSKPRPRSFMTRAGKASSHLEASDRAMSTTTSETVSRLTLGHDRLN